MNRFEWTSPRNLAQATTAAGTTVAAAMVTQSSRPAADATVFKAGGIDLLDLMKEGLLTPSRVLDLRALPGLDLIEETKDGLRVGANATLAQIAAAPVVGSRYRALAEAVGASASPQIRNIATIAGNLLQRPRCWYFRSAAHHCVRKGGYACFAFGGENQHHAVFDHNGCAIVHPSTAATALVALGAKLELVDASAQKRVVNLESFFVLPEVNLHHENTLRPGEIVTAVLLPPMSATMRSAHLKQGELDSFDWPIADVAAVLDLAPDRTCRQASIVLGSAAPIPKRAVKAEAALVGKIIDTDSARVAGRMAIAGAMPLTKNAYKLPIIETLVRRVVLAAAAG